MTGLSRHFEKNCRQTRIELPANCIYWTVAAIGAWNAWQVPSVCRERVDEMKEENKVMYDRLIADLRRMGRVAVAFSSGVDSTLLLKAAVDALGDQVLAVTARSRSFPERENLEAAAFCRENGVEQVVVEVDQLSIEGFRDNPPDRCYICKKHLFTAMMEAAAERGFHVVAEGSNMDDLADYRPGLKAIAELGVRSPLRDAGFTKAQIRAISRDLGLPTWKKQSFACLATRFVYGEHITNEKLDRVDKAEQLLMDLGFGQLRVRIHGEEGKLARIEVMPEEFDKLLHLRDAITRKYREFGFDYVAMDLSGYRTGSMNEAILK